MRTQGRSGRLLVAAVVLCACGPVGAEQTVGLFLNGEDSFDGYTLFAPVWSGKTYLINNEGKLVHLWNGQFANFGEAYLLENGELLRVERTASDSLGRVARLAWDGSILWEVEYDDDEHRQHHDVEPLPNGNVLVIAWEVKSAMEAIDAGRDPATAGAGLWPLHVIEVEPDGVTGGRIVWEWHVWDHLVQDFDPTKANFGVVADNPGLMDINYYGFNVPDWLHANAIDYNPTFDQILLSLGGLSEIWIIDHSTTSEEAAGHTGGNSGKGGDILYRWGNPEVYDRGGTEDRKLFFQHDARWVEPGFPGAGNITIFNNDQFGPEGDYSTVDEIEPPVDANGHYTLPAGGAYGPDALTWTWVAEPPTSFFAQNTSGAHRLPNGNTLICHGPDGIFLEVNRAGEVVWHYVNPVYGSGAAVTQGSPASIWVFRIHRYALDYPGFDGKDLTPGDPLELFNHPRPAPAGSGATEPLRCGKTGAAGDEIRIFWDPWSCPATEYNLIAGDLAEVADYNPLWGECAIGTLGSYNWSNVPAGDLYFLVVGVDDCSIYESSWGANSLGEERNATSPSDLCGVTTKDVTLSCP